jgi:hypothetical protein
LYFNGLANGVGYTFTVVATNEAGNSDNSAATGSITPYSSATAPGAPGTPTAVAGNSQATVSFSSAYDGGDAILYYTVTASPGGQQASGNSLSLVVTGLTNGQAYTFTVTATNSIGTGASSAASNSVTPATVPGAPNIGTATGGNAQASVTFSPPGSNGGSTITSYEATSSPGGITATNSASPIVVTGLTNGVSYTFTIKATNGVGQGPASSASNSVTPIAPVVISHSPEFPTDFVAPGNFAQVIITTSA